MSPKTKLTSFALARTLAAAAIALCPATAQMAAAAEAPHSVIIFVADGLRAGSVNSNDAPTMFDLKSKGVWFTNSHSLYPTLTMANASAIATGHGLGDTSIFGNSLYVGPGSKNPAPFIENDTILTALRSQFGSNFPAEKTLLAGTASAQGYQTAVVGKLGPACLQGIIQDTNNPTIVIDDQTGSSNGVANAIETQLIAQGISSRAPGRSNDYVSADPRNNGNSNPGTTMANVVQQTYFLNVLAKVILPMFQTNKFVIVFWSRDPDGTQHNEGDSNDHIAPGINGRTSRQAVSNADYDLKGIYNALVRLRLTNTDIFITSDHGFDTISKHELDASGTNFVSSYATTRTYLTAPGSTNLEIPKGDLPRGCLSIDLGHYLGEKIFDTDSPLPQSSPTTYLNVDDSGSGNSIPRPLHGNAIVGGETGSLDDAKFVVTANGGSDFVYFLRKGTERAALLNKVVGCLQSLDYVSGIFINDDLGDIPGTLRFSDVGLNGGGLPQGHLPIPDIVASFATFSTNADFPEQSGVLVADTDLLEGHGNHGAFDRAATLNFMAAWGPDFKNNYIDPAPVCNADIAQTVAAILGLTNMMSHGRLSGRSIDEALAAAPDGISKPTHFGTQKSTVAPGALTNGVPIGGFQTVLNWQQYEGHFYYDAAGSVGRAIGLIPHSNVVVYVASPLGFSEATRDFMRQLLLPAIERAGATALNPWDSGADVDAQIHTVTKIDDLPGRRLAWRQVIGFLGEANAEAIRKADGVVAVLDGTDVDSGTAAEIGYATALGKWVVGYRADFRRTGEDEGAEVNLQVEYFVRSHGGVIAHSLDELAAELRNRTHQNKE